MTRTKFHHIAYEERCQVAGLLEASHSISSIARQLGRSNSSISKKVAPISGPGGYQHDEAQSQAESRRRQASALLWKLTNDRCQLICAKLRLQWSLEQIAGWPRREGLGQHQLQPHLLTVPEVLALISVCHGVGKTVQGLLM